MESHKDNIQPGVAVKIRSTYDNIDLNIADGLTIQMEGHQSDDTIIINPGDIRLSSCSYSFTQITIGQGHNRGSNINNFAVVFISP